MAIEPGRAKLLGEDKIGRFYSASFHDYLPARELVKAINDSLLERPHDHALLHGILLDERP